MMKKLAALLLLTSCIATTEVREDYEGRWLSDYLPFGNLASEVVIDMHDGHTDVEVDHEHVGGGHYTVTEDGAVFGWTLDIHGTDILFLDASRKGEVLFVRWKPTNFWYPYTSAFNQELTTND